MEILNAKYHIVFCESTEEWEEEMGEEGNMSSTEDTNMNPISVRILLPTFQGEFPRTGAMCTSEQEKRVKKELLTYNF